MQRIRIAVPVKALSKDAQIKLFSLGVPWGDGTFEIKDHQGFLFADEYGGIRKGSGQQFKEAESHGYTLVDLDQIKHFDASPYADHSRSAFAKHRACNPSDYA